MDIEERIREQKLVSSLKAQIYKAFVMCLAAKLLYQYLLEEPLALNYLIVVGFWAIMIGAFVTVYEQQKPFLDGEVVKKAIAKVLMCVFVGSWVSFSAIYGLRFILFKYQSNPPLENFLNNLWAVSFGSYVLLFFLKNITTIAEEIKRILFWAKDVYKNRVESKSR